MTPQLHNIIGRGNSYCGPAAIAALTGCTTQLAAYYLRVASGKKKILGVNERHVLEVLSGCGGRCIPAPTFQVRTTKPVRVTPRLSLERWAERVDDGLYLVVVTGHYVAVRKEGADIQVTDNHCYEPFPLKEFRRRRMLVRSAWLIWGV